MAIIYFDYRDEYMIKVTAQNHCASKEIVLFASDLGAGRVIDFEYNDEHNFVVFTDSGNFILTDKPSLGGGVDVSLWDHKKDYIRLLSGRENGCLSRRDRGEVVDNKLLSVVSSYKPKFDAILQELPDKEVLDVSVRPGVMQVHSILFYSKYNFSISATSKKSQRWIKSAFSKLSEELVVYFFYYIYNFMLSSNGKEVLLRWYLEWENEGESRE